MNPIDCKMEDSQPEPIRPLTGTYLNPPTFETKNPDPASPSQSRNAKKRKHTVHPIVYNSIPKYSPNETPSKILVYDQKIANQITQNHSWRRSGI